MVPRIFEMKVLTFFISIAIWAAIFAGIGWAVSACGWHPQDSSDTCYVTNDGFGGTPEEVC
jgi:hypothetical protein